MKTENKIIGIAVIFSLIVSLGESILDYFFFKNHPGTFLELLLFEIPPYELYIRFLTLVSFLAFGLLASGMYKRRQTVEEKFRILFENTSDLIQSIAPDGHFIYVNHAWEKALGYTKDELSGFTAFDLIHPAERLHCEDLFRNIMAGGSAQNIETTFVTKSGKKVQVEGNITPTLIDGEVVSTQGIFHDVTEHKEAEKTLAESEKKYSTLVEKGNDGIVIIQNGVFKFINSKMEEITKFSIEEAMGKPFSDYVSPESRELVMERYKKRMSEEDVPAKYELVIIDKDGAEISTEVNASIIEFEGRPADMAIVRDITERKIAEGELRIFKDFAESSGLGYGFADLDGDIVYINPKLSQILSEEEPEDAIGKNVASYYPEEERAQLVEEILPTVMKEGKWSGELPLMSTGGAITPTIQNISLIRDEKNAPLYIGNIITDISDRKKWEDTLRESEEKFRTLADQSPNMIFINKMGRVVYANKLCEEVMDYKREEFYSEDFDFMSLIAPCDIDRVKNIFTRHMKGDDVEPYEYGLMTKDGKTIEALITTKIINYEGGPAILGIITDITERKEAEEELKILNEKLELRVMERTAELTGVNEELTAASENLEATNEQLVQEIAERERSQENYRSLFENANDSIFIIDPQSQSILDVNENAAIRLGYTKEELRKTTINDIASPVDASQNQARVKELQEKGSIIFEHTHLRKDKTEMPVEISSRIVPYGDKKVIQAFVRDITERKEVEKDLVQSKEFSETILNSMEDAISIIDANDFKIISVNQYFLDQVALNKEDVIGKTCFEVTHQCSEPCKGPLDACPLKETLKKDITASYEHTHFDSKGNPFYVEVTTHPIKDGKGEVVQVVHVARNITERKKVEKALEESEKRYRLITETSADGIYQIDLSGNITYVNKAHADMFGYTEDELIGKNFSEIVSPKAMDEAMKLNKQLLKGKSVEDEGIGVHKDGHEFITYFHVSPVYKEDKIVGISGTVRDITDRKETEKQIKQSLIEKETLLKEVHHRVKNNLQSISSLLYLQSKSTDDEVALELLQESQNRVATMALIHEKLYQSEDLTEIDFKDYILTLINNLFESYNVKPGLIDLTTDIGEIHLGVDKAISCGLIINELISNSLQHSFPEAVKGLITVTAHTLETGEIELTISDNGIGLPDELDIKMTKSLGLKLVKRFTDKLRASLEIDGSHGTEFKIRFLNK